MGGSYACNPCIEETESRSSIIEVEPYVDVLTKKTNSNMVNSSCGCGNNNNIMNNTPGMSMTKDKIKAIIKSNSTKNKKEQKQDGVDNNNNNTSDTTMITVSHKEQISSEKEKENDKKPILTDTSTTNNNNNSNAMNDNNNNSSLNKTNDVSHNNNTNVNKDIDKEFLPKPFLADNAQETKEQLSEDNCFPPVDTAVKLQSVSKDNNTNNKPDVTTKPTNNSDNKGVPSSLPSKTLFSVERLNALQNDEIVFYGSLQKMVNNVDRRCISYTTRFCVLTKECFFYFATKETFMCLYKPLCKLPLQHVVRVEGDNKEYFCLVFNVNDDTSPLIVQTNTFDAVTDTKRNQKEGMLAFHCDSPKETKKWIAVIEYLISSKS